jgi:hypothetical protein
MSLPYPQGLLGTTTVSVWVTVTKKGEEYPFFRQWTGSSFNTIRTKAKAKYAAEYPGCKVEFGKSWSETSYGAH